LMSAAAFALAALGTFGKTDLDNTDVARDHSFHCIANAESGAPANHTMHVGLTVSISSTPFPKFVILCSSIPGTNLGNNGDPGKLMPSGAVLSFRPPATVLVPKTGR
jgi:hypothetical protein